MVVVNRHPARRGLMFLAVLLVAVVALLGGYAIGLYQAGVDHVRLTGFEVTSVDDQQRIIELNRQLVDLKLTRKVDQQASIALRQTIKDLRDDVAVLNEEITFYRALMDPASLDQGLQIAEFQMQATDTGVDFRLLLTHASKRRDLIKGVVHVEVHGRRSDEQLVLLLTDLAQMETYPLPFKFRYFQDLSGSLSMPVDFEPDTVVVTAKQSGNSVPVTKEFHWSVRTGEEATSNEANQD